MIRLAHLALAAFWTVAVAHADDQGFKTYRSDATYQNTLARLVDDLTAKGLYMTTIEHALNAENAGLELNANAVVMFGNPKLGTKLMQADPRIGVDLPMKMLVWDDADGVTHVGYWDPRPLADDYAIGAETETLETMAGALSAIAQHAAGK